MYVLACNWHLSNIMRASTWEQHGNVKTKHEIVLVIHNLPVWKIMQCNLQDALKDYGT